MSFDLGENVTDSSVLVVKTHDHLSNSKNQFHKVILIVRNPHEALQSLFNYIYSSSHVGHASINSYKSHWTKFVYEHAITWAQTNTYWFGSFPNPSSRHILFYEDLVNNTENELKKVLAF